MVVGVGRGLCIDVSRVHDFHGNAANPSQNGTLRHADINHVLSQRAQEKIDKYRAGYAAQGVRKAFLPAVVSTSGRIHGDLLRLLYLLADNKTERHFRDRHEVIDDDSEAYCWRRSGFFWRMRASLGLACAQATMKFFLCLSLSFCLSLEVTVTSLHPPRLCRIAVFSIKPTFLSC